MIKKQFCLSGVAFIALLALSLPAFAGQEMTMDGYIQKTVEASPAAAAAIAEIQGMEATAIETGQRTRLRTR